MEIQVEFDVREVDAKSAMSQGLDEGSRGGW